MPDDHAAQPIDAAPPVQLFGIIDPDYARIFTQARIVAWSHGYACLAHGSFTRDLDLLLVALGRPRGRRRRAGWCSTWPA